MRDWALLTLLLAVALAVSLQGPGFFFSWQQALPQRAGAYNEARDYPLWRSVVRKLQAAAALAQQLKGHGSFSSATELGMSEGALWSRVLIVADLHGDLEQARAVLRLVGAVDEGGRWAAGRALLVQLGDLVDRGDNSLGVIDLFSDLQAQASEAGGKVVCLLGNHELMLITGDNRYVNRDELRRLGKQALTALNAGEEAADHDPEARTREVAAGRTLWASLMAAEGRYGALLRSRPIAHIVRASDLETGSGGDTNMHEAGPGPCDILFVHAGALEWMLEAVDRLAAEAGPDVAAADSAEAAAPDPLTPDQYIDTWNSAVAAGLAECSGRACPSHDSPGAPLAVALLGGEGAVWTRALAQQQPSARACRQVERVIQRLGVSRIVVGHTIQEDGVSIRCGGRLLLADVGMSSWIVGALAGLRCSSQEGLQLLVPGQKPRLVALDAGS